MSSSIRSRRAATSGRAATRPSSRGESAASPRASDPSRQAAKAKRSRGTARPSASSRQRSPFQISDRRDGSSRSHAAGRASWRRLRSMSFRFSLRTSSLDSRMLISTGTTNRPDCRATRGWTASSATASAAAGLTVRSPTGTGRERRSASWGMVRSASSGRPAGTAVNERSGPPGRRAGSLRAGGGRLSRRSRPAIAAASSGAVPARGRRTR